MGRTLFKFWIVWIPLMIVVVYLTNEIWSLLILLAGYLMGTFHSYLIEKEVLQ